jgi:GrpB-like predicted nucleotidyltransferase (UPF0157 family)
VPAPREPADDEAVRIAAYDPDWPLKFEAERADLLECIGPWVTGGIHHVGSTSVRGLPAKPVIDILAGVESLDRSRPCIEKLASLRYPYAPYRGDVMHWFCKPHPAHRTHHLHLVPAGSRRYRDELAFRDALREDPALAAEYAALKHELAARFPDDRDAYTEHKAPFVRRVLAAAACWPRAAAVYWRPMV